MTQRKTKTTSASQGLTILSVDREQPLADRVANILDQARGNVVRAVNSNMVIAYWLIGREIVQALQGGEDRADYGRRLLEDLSSHLTRRFGRGFSVTNLKYFRLFYQAYPTRSPEIRHEARDELGESPDGAVLSDLETSLEAGRDTGGFSSCHRSPSFARNWSAKARRSNPSSANPTPRKKGRRGRCEH